MTRTEFLALAAVLAGAGPVLRAQQDDALLTLTGFQGNLYIAVAAVGDTDGDGITEILVGDPSFTPGGCSTGRYSLHSGSDGALLAEGVGTQCGLDVGYAVCDAGDQNGDRVPDYLVAATPNSLPLMAPVAALYSGADGSLLHDFSSAIIFFQPTLARLDDTDDDGVDELVIGDWSFGAGSVGGKVRIYRGGDFSLLHEISAGPTESGFGYAIAGIGDVDHDGAGDLAISAPYGSVPGSVRVVSGRTAGELFTLEGEPPLTTTGYNEQFGISLAGAGDVDADGWPDILVGLTRDYSQSPELGKARVYSGSDGSLLLGLHPGPIQPQFGAALCGLGDVDLDGYDDVVVSDYGIETPEGKGRVYIFSGRSGAIVKTFDSVIADEWLGNRLCRADDLNGDTFPDLVVAGWHNVYVLSGGIDADPGFTAILSSGGGALGDALGTAVARLGDVDGDGWNDVAAGAPGSDAGGLDSGAVRVLGHDGRVLLDVPGAAPGEHFGSAVAAAGDVDGDGRPDLIAGAPDGEFGGLATGLARAVSGADGSTLFEWHGEAAGDAFGTAVAGAGDVDGDGRPDLAVGAPLRSLLKVNAGALYVFSGQTGLPLYQLEGATAQARLGRAVVPIADLGGDGRPDLVVGAPGEKVAGVAMGVARVITGATGAELLALVGTDAGGAFGQTLASPGDLDLDGEPDLVVGSPAESTGPFDPSVGAVRAFSGADGSLLFEQLATVKTTTLASSLGGASDANADGRPDVIVGIPNPGGGTQPGQVQVLSGLNGTLIATLVGAAPADQFGISVDSAELDGDGFSDIVVGASAGADSGGAVYAFTLVKYWKLFPGGIAGLVGVPKMTGSGALVPHATVGVQLEHAAPSAPAVMVAGLDTVLLPFKGGVLVPSPDVTMSFATDASGSAGFTAVWPSHWPPGIRFYLQAFISDPEAPQGLAASNALQGTPH